MATDRNGRESGNGTEAGLEAFFAAARDTAPAQAAPPADLVARILADAAAEAASARRIAAARGPVRATHARRPGLHARIGSVLSAIGGWPAATGLAAAAAAGIWLGYSPPAGLGAAFDGWFGAAVVYDTPAALLADYAMLGDEG